MPRSIGIGNADNIQQRARFFGYKRSYLGLCRIYLTNDNIEAFQSYVSHEESVRKSISQHIKNGQPLKDWRRTWYLNRPYGPTRKSVIVTHMHELRSQEGWIYPDYPYEGSDFVADNRQTVNLILKEFDFQEYHEEGWNEWQTIPAFSDKIPLSKIIPFIGQLRYPTPSDSAQHSAIMTNLEKLDEESPNLLCSLYAFSGPWSGVNARRSLSNQKPPKIKNLFQGRNIRTNYPGARKIRSHGTITFQIHRYDVQNFDKSKVLLKDMPVLAVYFPRDFIKNSLWIEG